MAATDTQKRNWAWAFVMWSVHYRDIMRQGQELANLYADLGLSGSGIVQTDLTNELTGLSVSDLQAAVAVAGQVVGEFTRARETAFNKVSLGQP
jgi:hypothetical protein